MEKVIRISDPEDKTIYRVIVNQEQQYSVWPADREARTGWRDVGKAGTHRECIDYIKQVWKVFLPPQAHKTLEEIGHR